ncbi:MAG: hypothetical protein IBX69_05760 [Anaerolineales bacterium]|nr:hypothetical protein [Anaerolineales bacterium]
MNEPGGMEVAKNNNKRPSDGQSSKVDFSDDQPLTDQYRHPPEVYEFRIEGYLSPLRSEWFDWLVITNLENGDTLLTGQVTDQPALHGLLAKIRDMNLKLISVKKI